MSSLTSSLFNVIANNFVYSDCFNFIYRDDQMRLQANATKSDENNSLWLAYMFLEPNYVFGSLLVDLMAIANVEIKNSNLIRFVTSWKKIKQNCQPRTIIMQIMTRLLIAKSIGEFLIGLRLVISYWWCEVAPLIGIGSNNWHPHISSVTQELLHLGIWSHGWWYHLIHAIQLDR